jgi:putative flippase GtrA
MSPNLTHIKEFILYGIVVGIGLFVDVGLLYLLTVHLGMWYLVASGIAFTTALTLNYVLMTRFVFIHRSLENTRHEFLVFFLIGVSALILNQVVMYVAVDVYATAVLTAKAIALPITFSWSFGLNKFLLFRNK